MPSMGKLFSLSDASLRVAFKAVSSLKIHVNGLSHHAISNGVEEFKAKNGFDNYHLEIPMALINQQMWHYVKLGYCDELQCVI